MPSRVPLPADLDPTAFAVASGLAHGLSQGRMRGPDLVAPFFGVRASIRPTTVVELAHALKPRIVAGQAISGMSAAAIWGLPLPPRLADKREIEVAVVQGATRLTGNGIRSREVRPRVWAVQEVDGLCVTTPLLTWCLLAKYCTIPELIRAGDALVSTNRKYVGRKEGFTPVHLPRLAAAAKCWACGTGAPKLRLAAPFVRDGVASPPETDMRLLLIDAGLPEFEINQPIFRADGSKVGIVDGLLREEKIVFEYEGDGHRTDQAQFRKDIRRYAEFEALGYRTVRATGDDVYKDKKAYQQRAWAVYDSVLRQAG